MCLSVIRIVAEAAGEAEEGTAVAYNSPNVSCFAGPAGPGYTYWAVSIADDENGTRFVHQQDDLTTVHAKLLAKLESLQQPGYTDFVTHLIRLTSPQVIFVQRSQQVQSISQESTPRFLDDKSKKTVLCCVGDAAHAMSPSYGQAANFCFEDAAVLTHCISEKKEVVAAVSTYARTRAGRCQEMMQRSQERLSNQLKGKATENVFEWIAKWEPTNTIEEDEEDAVMTVIG